MSFRAKLGALAVAVLAVAAVAGMAVAGIQDSNHDMVSLLGLSGSSAQAGTCSFCHVPHKAASANLFPSDCTVSGQWGSDTNAKLCYTCHGWNRFGATSAQNVNPFSETADGVHGRYYDNLVTWGDVTDTGTFQGYSIPYDNTTANSISCASCHNPHDNSKRPFIRDAIRSGVTYTEGNFGTWCTSCHVKRADNAKTGSHTNHPFNDNITDGALANIKAFADIGSNFKTAVSPLDCTMSDAWNLGGHVFDSGSGQTMHCGTCHLTHSNETATFDASDASSKVATKVQNLNGSLLAYAAKPADSSTSDLICMNCHDATNASAGPGIGGVSHKFDNTWSGLTIDATGVAASYGAKFGGPVLNDGSGPTRLICQSCHDAHFARVANSGSSAPDNTYKLVRVVCGDCHSNSSSASGHHPSGITVNAGKFGTVAPASTSTPLVYSNDGTRVTSNLNGKVTVGSVFSWADVDNTSFLGMTPKDDQQWRALYTSSGSYYSFSGADNNVMDCGTCHGGTGGKAHNNAVFPGLTGTMTGDVMCIDCHSTNPSLGVAIYADNTDRFGTHMVGVPAEGGNISAKYKWKAGDASGSDVTPKAGSGLVRYAAGAAADGALICTSCHTVKYKSPVAPQHSVNTDVNETTADNVSLLLSPSGNQKDDTSGDAADHICSACHGGNPGATTAGQTTHKTQPGTQSDASTGIQTAVTANKYVTLVSNKINCESCHRPHVAAGTSKTKILEDAGIDTSFIEETNLCVRCHTK